MKKKERKEERKANYSIILKNISLYFLSASPLYSIFLKLTSGTFCLYWIRRLFNCYLRKVFIMVFHLDIRLFIPLGSNYL